MRGYRPNVDRQILERHRQWLGLLQPEGLVVSAAALQLRGLVVDHHVAPYRDALAAMLAATTVAQPTVPFPALAKALFAWPDGTLVDAGPDDERGVPEYPGDRLTPSHVLRDLDGKPQLLVQVALRPAGLDDSWLNAATDRPHAWPASPQVRFEKLLRDSGYRLGLLYDGALLRLVYAPRGETSGHLSFPLGLMTTTDGRVVLGALRLLLGVARLFPADPKDHLDALCRESRDYQNTVSDELAKQVLNALNALLMGLAAADGTAGDARAETFRRAYQEAGAEHVYGGLLTTIMRLVFLLYAEEKGLMPEEPVYLAGYSVRGLYERLREDDGRYHDTMHERFGAWAQLVSLFRLVHEGTARARSDRAGFVLPTRHGELFDPSRYPFLEGRVTWADQDQGGGQRLPRVSDGVVFAILKDLVMLGGERLSYRALAVEQIGSVYQNMMGFEVLRVEDGGPRLALTPLSLSVDLEALLAVAPGDRKRHLEQQLRKQKVPARVVPALVQATSVDALEAALEPMRSPLSRGKVPVGGFYLEPTDERRKSGTHYTPQALTEPIVRKTLEPLLEDLRKSPRAIDGVPHPDDLLELKVCDPAMGSAAFLVETIRQLGAELERAWQKHGKPSVRWSDGQQRPLDPAVETLIHAQRYVAERCIYGVDKNAFAVSLGKLSLWLATLAADRPFTFVDDSIRHGDSLVGLSRAQLESFTWETVGKGKGKTVGTMPWVKERVKAARAAREKIVALQGSDEYDGKARLLDEADAAMREVRLVGDACVAAYFGAESDKLRKLARDELAAAAMQLFAAGESAARERLLAAVTELHEGERPVVPFHWEVEFPEVFERDNPGFDAFVGNPPFAGKNTVASGNREGFTTWLQVIHDGSHGNADLVAHFFRRAFSLLRKEGTFGLIATNTIAQGDTRESGLTWICQNGGSLYAARKRYRWPLPGAAVIVSVVHARRGAWQPPAELDGLPVERISAYLVSGRTDSTPRALSANAGLSFVGSYVLGMGFTFDDESSKEVGGSIADYERLYANPHNRSRLFPYIGGEELNSDPRHAHRRYVINFGQMSENEARRWPELMSIVETKVKPARLAQAREVRARYWWRFGEPTPALFDAIAGLPRVLANSRVSSHLGFAFMSPNAVFAETMIVYPLSTYAAFAALQCRVHEVWALLNASSLEDRLRYTPTDCFETFPFPPSWQTHPALEAAGEAYYKHRAALMIAHDEGLTKTYNRFHDPDEDAPALLELRRLHAVMDRAMLDAYGWTDLTDAQLTCDFYPVHADDDAADADDAEATPSDRDKKPKKMRYRWSDETRDLVLARLLAENERQAAATPTAGAPTTAPTTPPADDTFTLAAPTPTPKKRGKKPTTP